MNTSEWRGDFNKGFRYIRNERRAEEERRRGEEGGQRDTQRWSRFPFFFGVPSILIKRSGEEPWACCALLWPQLWKILPATHLCLRLIGAAPNSIIPQYRGGSISGCCLQSSLKEEVISAGRLQGKYGQDWQKKINMQRDSMQREQLKAVRVALLLLKALFWERGWLASGLRNTWEWTWYSVITYRWEIWGFSLFF